jgi:hypothetical protein
VTLPAGAAAMLYDDVRDRLYVGGSPAARTGVAVINPATATVENNITLSDASAGLALNRTTGILYVATGSGVYVIDTALGLTTAKVPTSTNSVAAVAVAVDPGLNRTFVLLTDTSQPAGHDDAILAVIDGQTNAIIGSIALPQAEVPLGLTQPGAETWLAVDDTTHTVYALVRNDQNGDYLRLYAISGQTLAIQATADGEDNPEWMAIDVADRLLVVAGGTKIPAIAHTLHVIALDGELRELTPIATGLQSVSGAMYTKPGAATYLAVAGVNSVGLVSVDAYTFDASGGGGWRQAADGVSETVVGSPFLTGVTYAKAGDRMEVYLGVEEGSGTQAMAVVERFLMPLP